MCLAQKERCADMHFDKTLISLLSFNLNWWYVNSKSIKCAYDRTFRLSQYILMSFWRKLHSKNATKALARFWIWSEFNIDLWVILNYHHFSIFKYQMCVCGHNRFLLISKFFNNSRLSRLPVLKIYAYKVDDSYKMTKKYVFLDWATSIIYLKFWIHW